MSTTDDTTRTTTPTPEQRAAVEWLRAAANQSAGRFAPNYARVLLDALPATLTAPQPALPTEPGDYKDKRGKLWTFDGQIWWHGHDERLAGDSFLLGRFPFTRLVPERAPITREQVRSAIGSVVTNVLNYPDEVSSHLLGRDLSGLIEKAADAILALVNGEPR